MVVLGMGNSAMDIAVEACYRRREDLPRRPPRRLRSCPSTCSGGPSTSTRPTRACRWRCARGPPGAGEARRRRHGALRPAQARPPLRRGASDASPTPSSTGIAHGEIAPKPNIARARGRQRALRRRHRRAGRRRSSTARATRSPSRSSTRTSSPRPTTTCRCSGASSIPSHANLFFIGLLQPLGAIMPLAEAQGRWIADYLRGEYALPSRGGHARRHRATSVARMFKRYVASKRHTMQVDFDDYLYDLGRERQARGRARPGAGLPAAGRGPCGRRPGRAARGVSPRRADRRGQAGPDEGHQPRGDPARGARGLRRAGLRRGGRARHRAPHRPRHRHLLQLLPRQGGDLPRARRRVRGGGAGTRRGRPGAGHQPRGLRRRRLPRVLLLRGPRARDVPPDPPQRGHDPGDHRGPRARRAGRRPGRRPGRGDRPGRPPGASTSTSWPPRWRARRSSWPRRCSSATRWTPRPPPRSPPSCSSVAWDASAAARARLTTAFGLTQARFPRSHPERSHAPPHAPAHLPALPARAAHRCPGQGQGRLLRATGRDVRRPALQGPRHEAGAADRLLRRRAEEHVRGR